MIARLGANGLETVEAGIEALLAYSEQRTRIRIRELGRGAASGEAVIDDDGVCLGLPLRVKVTISIDGRR